MDWGEALKAALAMGVAPEAFWRLSLTEWRMLAGPAAGTAPMSRRELDALRAAWPDEGRWIHD